MFHTPIDTRLAASSAAGRFLAFGDQPLRFPADMDLCREMAPSTVDRDVQRFAAEARKSGSLQALRATFSAADWRLLSSFCVARRVAAGTRVLIPGRSDRTLRFVVEGSLWQESSASTRVAAVRPSMVMPGALLGEDALFSDGPCEWDARTLEDTLVLELTLPRQKELTAACPAIAFELLRAAGAIIAARGRAAA